MKGTNLGEFEELVMLTVGVLHPGAYGVGIKQEILNQTKRKVTLSMDKLSQLANIVREAQEIRQSMYQVIPSYVLDQV